ncbi:hypothetical protein P692DRAFT_20826844 [Suillus brevipes Sb2]|nr:hypothetical protein P692DRAFT_20826844 [Suillus brevipes Sb2]
MALTRRIISCLSFPFSWCPPKLLRCWALCGVFEYDCAAQCLCCHDDLDDVAVSEFERYSGHVIVLFAMEGRQSDI